MSLKKIFILHPFLFSVYFILYIWARNVGQISFSEVVVPLFLTLLVTIAGLYVLKCFFKSCVKAGLMVSLFIILFFSYGHIYNIISDTYVFGFEIGRHRFFSLLYFLILVLAVLLIKRLKGDLKKITGYLNFVALILIGVCCWQILLYDIKCFRWRIDKAMAFSENHAEFGGDMQRKPDIYYIILDGYARNDVLKNLYGFDNSKFTNQLEKRGFYVAYKSRSNYAMTFMSLASSLNMKYLDSVVKKVGVEAKGRVIPDKVYQNSAVHSFMKLKGYMNINFASGWGPTNRNKYADKEYKNFCAISSEFLSSLVGTTWLQPLSLRVIEQDARKRILYTFDEIVEIPEYEEPTFTFAHILIPHTLLFGKNGEELSMKSFFMGEHESSFEKKEYYTNQLVFLNKKVLEFIDEILVKSKIKPVIILQADHGVASSGWNELSAELMNERLSIFNAYYLPDGGCKSLYSTITPVNSFRLIFNLYFNGDYKLLPDRSYFSTYEYPYKFIEVLSSDFD